MSQLTSGGCWTFVKSWTIMMINRLSNFSKSARASPSTTMSGVRSFIFYVITYVNAYPRSILWTQNPSFKSSQGSPSMFAWNGDWSTRDFSLAQTGTWIFKCVFNIHSDWRIWFISLSLRTLRNTKMENQTALWERSSSGTWIFEVMHFRTHRHHSVVTMFYTS